jgi:alkylation response protein AidB-like acyl-CoA dehydrogenase
MDVILRRADYAPGEDQETLRDSFSTFFRRECPTSRVREAEPGGFDADLWKQVSGMRVVAMGVPEASGGDGAGLEELVILAEEHGSCLAPLPLVEAVVGARLLAAAGEAGAELSDALDGSAIFTLDLHPGEGPHLVPAAAVARGVIGLLGDELVLGVTDAPVPGASNQGHAPVAWWEMKGAGVQRQTLLVGPPAVMAYEKARREWKLLTASALIGMARASLDLGVTHARERVAFGAPIGTFQAISHSLVDVSMAVDTGRRLVYKAAWFAEHEPAAEPHLIPMAFLYAEEAAVQAATTAVHVLGGVGFTVESDAQLYFRRAKGWSLLAGDPQAELGLIADALYGPAGPA